jgi:hypothetical protein
VCIIHLAFTCDVVLVSVLYIVENNYLGVLFSIVKVLNTDPIICV